MNKNTVKKCRTCLKTSAKTFLLTETAKGCSPRKTYDQLLKEHVKFESNSDYEHLMPHYLCLLCCRELKKINAFVKQAQYCNDILLLTISKKMECLRENKIDFSENENQLEEIVDIEIKPSTSNLEVTQEEEENTETSKLTKQFEESDSNNEINIKEMPVKQEQNTNTTIKFKISSGSDEKEIIDLPQEFTETDTNKHSFEKNSEVLICPICEEDMSTNDKLILHMRTQHDIKEPTILLQKEIPERKTTRGTFDCELCPSKYSNRYSYLYHLIRKHNIDERKSKNKEIAKLNPKVIKCLSCDYTAKTYAALYYHNRSKHGTENDKFKCQFCDYLSIKKFDLFVHVKNVHKELIKTLKTEAENNGEMSKEINYVKLEDLEDYSDEEFSSDDNDPLVKKPNNSKTKNEEEKGDLSDEDFIRNILNIKKRGNKTPTTSLARKCDECGNIYKNHRALYAHQRNVHISEDKYSLCPHCGKKYKRKTDLRIHIERDHIVKNPNEISKQPARVREKRFMCTQCSYVCTTITILNIHISRKHTGEKPYKCDLCSKSFLIPYDLKIHSYLHTGERPYKCPICSKGFRDNSHMMKHKRLHSSERPFKCKECGKSFAIAYYLSVHNRTHLREKKLNCVTCGKVFENRSSLNLHRINENHQDEVA